MHIDIPGFPALHLDDLVLDVNGTLADRGEPIDGVAERLGLLAADLRLHLVTADTFGNARTLAKQLGASLMTVGSGAAKAAFVTQLGPDGTVAIGNGRNDEAMLRCARLGIVVIGPEGAAATALLASDLVCRSVIEALDLLLDPRSFAATLRI